MESSKITKWLKVIAFLLVIIIAQNAFIQKTTCDAYIEAQIAAIYASSADENAKEASGYAYDAYLEAYEASGNARKAYDEAYDANRNSFGNQCWSCP